MASENRQLPASNIARKEALDAAKLKNTAMGVNSFLTTPTKNRLLAIQPLYETKYNAIAGPKHTMNVLTAQKIIARQRCQMFCSHMVQVLNLAVDRGSFVKEDRAFYKLDVNTGNLPELGTEAQLIQFAKDVIQGETDRIAFGGAPLAFPDLVEVQAEFAAFEALLIPHTTAVDAYDTAQEALDAQNAEADKVIKKIWDEVETFYNEEDESSMRQNAREWGVVYVLVGGTKKVSGIITDSITHLPIADVDVRFQNGNKTVTTDAQGFYDLSTTLMGDQTLIAEHDLYTTYTTVITLVENQNQTKDFEMVGA